MRKVYMWEKVLGVFVLVLSLYSGIWAVEGVQETDLFSPAGIDNHEPTLDGGQIIRSRLVTIHSDQLCGVENALRTDSVSTASADTSFLYLNLFEDVYFKARINHLENTFSGGTSYAGHIENIPGSEIILVKTNDILSANINAGGRFYQVRPVSEGLHRVQEVDQTQFPQELPPVSPNIKKTGNRMETAMDSGIYIDILVVYTADARAGVGGTTAMENMIDLAVAETNTGYGNSGVSQRLRLVHTAEVAYSESGFNSSTTLSRLQKTSDGYMDDVHTLRDTYGADEVVLIVNSTSSCGIGYVMQFPTTAFAPYAFAVVSKNCATGYYSFAHELGHNMGCAHDRDNASVMGSYNYSYGYQAPDEAFRTILAYNCPGGCTRVNYWSNPDKQYGGQDMGVVSSDPEAADNRLALNNNLSTVRNFRQQASAPTITVTSPNGGETLTVGRSSNITWSTGGTVGNVKIKYYNENYVGGVTIVSSTANDGSYSWTVPNDVSTNCLVEISEASDGSPSDFSNAFFAIEADTPPDPTITIVSPNGGETLVVGSSHNIFWASSGTVGNVKIQYSTNNGSSWSTISSSTSNDGNYSWTVPNAVSSSCKVKISEASDGSPSDTSASTFSIVSASTATLTVTSPNGGESLAVGSSQAITWTSTGTVGNVKIQYSINNGSSWTTISSATTNDGTYSWTVPNAVSSSCKLKISEASDGSPSDTSNSTFSIVSATSPTITVTSPNSGESLEAGSSHSITWTSTGTVGKIKIKYSTDNGGSWSTIISSTSNDGLYSWTVPGENSSLCLVKVSEKDGSPSDTSNSTFSIVSASLSVTSPNGGENLEAGTSHAVTWTSTGTVGKVKIEYSTNNGSSWTTITSSTSNDGSYSWSIPELESSRCLLRISEASDGEPSAVSDSVFSIYSPEPPEIALNRTEYYFGAVIQGAATGFQSLRIDNVGGGTLNWTATPDANATWLACSPGSGANAGIVEISVSTAGLAAGEYSGTITVADTEAANSPQTVTVGLTVKPASQDHPPVGSFSTPEDGSTVSSSVPITGWVVDDVEVTNVKIYNGSDYVGDAVFVEGARPDIEQAYPGYPKNYQAGWGYMLLSYFLPNGGNGTYTLYAKAVDTAGHEVTLGSKTITVNNGDAVKPFGAIDSPSQGGTASGTNFTNSGWVLTAQPNKIPEDGSTIDVYVDSVKLGTANYNGYRGDIASFFPGYANSDGASAWFKFDTTAYANGIHSMYWIAADDAGNVDGIGSRFFIVQNTGADRAQDNAHDAHGKTSFVPLPLHFPGSAISVTTGYGKTDSPQTVYPGNGGVLNIEIRELERVVIRLGSGYQLRPLPIGSTFDPERGIFYWIPGPGFVGNYELLFVDKYRNNLKRVNIRILPRATRRVDPLF
ncbi:MAG: hypothetical protein GY950_29615 [bacterium]|nr:hypothetical protein [bacterium]